MTRASAPRVGKRATPRKADGRKAAKKRTRKREACFVYVLGCFRSGRYWTYVGWTNDLARRLERHNTGKGARSTRGRVWVLLHFERFATRQKAMSREWHLKRDRQFRKRLVSGFTSGEGVPSSL